MVRGADVDVEPPAAGLLELELLLEPQPAIPAMSAAAARPATADTPKCLLNTIGPPVSAPSGSTAAPRTPAGSAHRVARAWKIDPMYRPCQRVAQCRKKTVTELI